jgi:hypothetical protein
VAEGLLGAARRRVRGLREQARVPILWVRLVIKRMGGGGGGAARRRVRSQPAQLDSQGRFSGWSW